VNLLDPLDDPHPTTSGFSLSIGGREHEWRSLIGFIEAIYLHPTLGEDSMTFQAVKEINRLSCLEEIPIIAEKIQALGDDVALPQRTWDK
jgi:hypothetical protein